MEYSVVVHKAEERGFWAEMPTLPGCYSQGDTVKDALRDVSKAIALYLEVLRDEGRHAPRDAYVVHKIRAAPNDMQVVARVVRGDQNVKPLATRLTKTRDL